MENITLHGLLTPNSPGGLPTLSLTTNSSWLPWGISDLTIILHKTNTQLFTGRMPFLSPHQQCHSTEGENVHSEHRTRAQSVASGSAASDLSVTGQNVQWTPFTEHSYHRRKRCRVRDELVLNIIHRNRVHIHCLPWPTSRYTTGPSVIHLQKRVYAIMACSRTCTIICID